MSLQWYYAHNKQKLGPFSTEQMQQLLSNGQLQPNDFVFQEGTSKWVKAGSVPAFATPTSQAPSVTPPTVTLWYYRHGDTQVGPVSYETLKRLACTQSLLPSDLVWQEGTPAWQTAKDLVGLFDSHSPVATPAPVMPQPIKQASIQATPPTPQQCSAPQAQLTPTPAVGHSGPFGLVLGGFHSLFAIASTTLGETNRQWKLRGLRRTLAQQERDLREKVYHELGAILLCDGVELPTHHEILHQFKEANKAISLETSRSAKAQLERQLYNICVECGQQALQGSTAFPRQKEYAAKLNAHQQQIDLTKQGIANLQQQWNEAPAQTKNRVYVGLAGAGLLVCLLMGLSLWLLWPTATANSPASILLTSEATLRTLEGKYLKEATALLRSEDAKRELKADDKPANADKREKQVREFLRKRRASESLQDATAFLAQLNTRSRVHLTEFATSQGIGPQDLVTEWLTYDGALNLGLLTRIWNEKNNFRGDSAAHVATLLKNIQEAPSLEKPAVIVNQAKRRLELDIYGTHIIHEVHSTKRGTPTPNEAVVAWKSNYGYLRELLTHGSAKNEQEETLSLEQGVYRVDQLSAIQEYLKAGHTQRWATLLLEDSPLAVASMARDERIRAQSGFKQHSGDKTRRQSLRELFAKLAPSVPRIEAKGRGTGSGFLVQHNGRNLVVTNRHVVENASNGIDVHFYKSAGRGKEERHTIPATQTSVIAVHREADLALIDVDKATGDLKNWGIEPLMLAAANHTPQVGEHTFAIGHPGSGDLGMLLTRTLSDGIVSATGRKIDRTTFLQVTVPINPGNSGGPLFDDDGQVVGVNTLIARKNSNRDIALEALNFSLEISFVHELLNDPGKSYAEKEITEIVRGRPLPPGDSPILRLFRERTVAILGEGYRPIEGALEKSLYPGIARSGQPRIKQLTLQRGRSYYICGFNENAVDIDLIVWNHAGRLIAVDDRPDSTPIVHFTCMETGVYTMALMTPATIPAQVLLAVFEK
jgi:S1-C subfamily serine protease